VTRALDRLLLLALLLAAALAAKGVARAAGGGAPAAGRLYDQALAALEAGEPRSAEVAAEELAAWGGAEHGPLADFLLGNCAWARCERAARLAGRPDAGPDAFLPALRAAEDARDAWLRAARARADWPAARRNVERALRRLELLRDQHRSARERALRRGVERPREAPQPLLERLAEEEREKLDLRRARRRALRPSVEKDW